jgi:hypothetical protein
MSLPLEFYGQAIESNQNWPAIIGDHHCPYLNGHCKKLSTNSNKTTGNCIVESSKTPIITCPHRFLQDEIIFHNAAALLASGEAIRITQEFKLPTGNVDFVLWATTLGQPVDLLGLEIQAVDTTNSGGISACRKDLLNGVLQPSYNIGIDWKNAAKKSLIQLLHKVPQFEEIGKHLVFVIQTEFYDYISKEFTTGHLTDDSSLTLQFQIYDCVEMMGGGYKMELSKTVGTNSEGVVELLKFGGASPLELHNIHEKLNKKDSRLLSGYAPKSTPRKPTASLSQVFD